MTEKEAIRLADLIVERLAARRVDGPQTQGEPIWADAAGMAEVVGRSPQWVRENAGLLGGKRLGNGPKAPYLFNVAEALDRLPSCEGDRRSKESDSPAKQRRSRRRSEESSGTSADLLPIKGDRG